MRYPAVSVCVTTYNYAAFISQCIESVIRQTLRDWELLVFDNSSTDGTDQIVQRYAAQDARIRYARNESNIGMSPNLKRAADACIGRVIKVLCADDWLAPTCLEVMLAAMDANPSVVLCTSGEVNCASDGTQLRIAFQWGRPLSVVSGRAMLDRMAFGCGMGGNSSFMICASAYRRVGGYDPSIPYAADYDLAARLCSVGDYLHLDAPLFYGRNHARTSRVINRPRMLDVKDAFDVPAKIFQPRPLFSRNWLRFQILRVFQTMRYLTVALSQYGKGRREYARRLYPVVLAKGSIVFGVLLLPAYWSWKLGKSVARAMAARRG